VALLAICWEWRRLMAPGVSAEGVSAGCTPVGIVRRCALFAPVCIVRSHTRALPVTGGRTGSGPTILYGNL
jgi:hypothetical protein